MFGTAPGNSIPGTCVVEEPFAFVDAVPDAEAAAGNKPAAWASAAFTSAEFMRTSLSPSPVALGCSRRLSFSWNDCALAAATAGATGAATGDGLRSTRTSVTIEIAKVAKLIVRCSFRRHLHFYHDKPRRSAILDDGGEGPRGPTIGGVMATRGYGNSRVALAGRRRKTAAHGASCRTPTTLCRQAP